MIFNKLFTDGHPFSVWQKKNIFSSWHFTHKWTSQNHETKDWKKNPLIVHKNKSHAQHTTWLMESHPFLLFVLFSFFGHFIEIEQRESNQNGFLHFDTLSRWVLHIPTTFKSQQLNIVVGAFFRIEKNIRNVWISRTEYNSDFRENTWYQSSINQPNSRSPFETCDFFFHFAKEKILKPQMWSK